MTDEPIQQAAALLDDALAASGGDYGEAAGSIGGCDVVVSVAHYDRHDSLPPINMDKNLCWVWCGRADRFDALTDRGGPEALVNMLLLTQPMAKILLHVAHLAAVVDEHVDDLLDAISETSDESKNKVDIASFVYARIYNCRTGAEQAFAVLDMLGHGVAYDVRTMQDGSVVWVVLWYADQGSAEDLMEDIFCWADNDVWAARVQLPGDETQDYVRGDLYGTDWLRNGAAAWVVEKVKEVHHENV